MGVRRVILMHRPGRRAIRGALASIAVLSALSLAACTARQSADTPIPPPPPRELRAGITPNYPPLAFKQNGKLVGVEPDFAGKLGPALGMSITLVEMDWADLIPALRDRRIDIIMSGMSITADRRALVGFAHPYLRVGEMMLVRRADAHRLPDNRAVNQPATRVGFVTGTTGETYVRDHLKRAQFRGFESVEAGVAALRAGQIDAFVHDAPSIYSITAGSERELVGRYEPLTEEYLAWAVRADDSALRIRLDTVLTRWNSDGTLDQVLGKWIKVRRKAAPAK